MFHVRVNDEPHEIAEHTTLAALVELLELVPERVAIELNRKVVRRADWPQVFLADGDRIEIVHFVGGGADNKLPRLRALAGSPSGDFVVEFGHN